MNKTLLDRIGKKRLRATFTAAALAEQGTPRFGQIDEANGIIHDVQISLEGEAKGHSIWLGKPFLDAVAQQGQESEHGIKVRFGHPSMCADALGTFLGRAKNFTTRDITRKDGTPAYGVFADIHLAQESRNGPGGRDVYAWTLATAKNHPDTFGQSIVFTYGDFYVIDADGEMHKWSDEPEVKEGQSGNRWSNWKKKSADGRTYAMLGKLHGTDFTDSPAATDGVFSQFDTLDPDTLAQEATDLLDAHPRIVAMLTERPEAVAEFLDRYNAALAASGKPPVRLVAAIDDPAEKRLAALQSAKDSELAAQRTDFQAQTQKLTGDLEAAQAALSTAQAERDALETALAETREQLAQEQANHAAITGASLAHTEAGGALTWESLRAQHGYAEARKRYPEVFKKRFGIN